MDRLTAKTPEGIAYLAKVKNGEQEVEGNENTLWCIYESWQRLARYEDIGITLEDMTQPRPLDDWHEDYGPVLWWSFPIEEPPYCGSPLDCDWPGYHTHWTKIVMPIEPEKVEREEDA